MSLHHYRPLQAHSQDDAHLLGATLPKLEPASLQLRSQHSTTAGAIAAITTFAAEQGWIMYRDRLDITSSAPTEEDFIEGEWNRGDQSLQIKLLGQNEYLITTFSPTESGDDNDNPNQAYTQQRVFIRNRLRKADQANHNGAGYRLWWQQENSGEHQGRWSPLAQQFMGFCHIQEAR